MTVVPGFELMDATEVTSSSESCVVDFTVWCPHVQSAVSVRCEYSLSSDTLVAKWPDVVDSRTTSAVVHSKACRAEAKEMVMATRDFNREKN